MTDLTREKKKAEKALAIAKAIPRKVIYLQKGITGEVLSDTSPVYYARSGNRKNIEHSAVLEMLKTHTQAETARKFRITSQAVGYIKNKHKQLKQKR